MEQVEEDEMDVDLFGEDQFGFYHHQPDERPRGMLGLVGGLFRNDRRGDHRRVQMEEEEEVELEMNPFLSGAIPPLPPPGSSWDSTIT